MKGAVQLEGSIREYYSNSHIFPIFALLEII